MRYCVNFCLEDNPIPFIDYTGLTLNIWSFSGVSVGVQEPFSGTGTFQIVAILEILNNSKLRRRSISLTQAVITGKSNLI